MYWLDKIQFISVLLYLVLTPVFEKGNGWIIKPTLDTVHLHDLKDLENYTITTPEGSSTPQILPEETDFSTVFRLKRSDNVIEEENLGTTMSWYKYTWRDSRLDDNDSKFKNINS